MLKELNLNQLKQLKEELNEYSSIDELRDDLDTLLVLKKDEYDKDIRTKFNIDFFKKIGLFSPYELEVLNINNINNLLDLIECDLGNMIGIDSGFKEKLLWTIRMFDCSNYVNNIDSKQL